MRRRNVRRRGRRSAISTRPVSSAHTAATDSIPAGERQNRSASDRWYGGLGVASSGGLVYSLVAMPSTPLTRTATWTSLSGFDAER